MDKNSENGRAVGASGWSGRLRSRSESEDNSSQVSSSSTDNTFSSFNESLLAYCDMPDSISQELVLNRQGTPIRSRSINPNLSSSATRVTRSTSRSTPATAGNKKGTPASKKRSYTPDPVNSRGSGKTTDETPPMVEKIRNVKRISKQPRPFPPNLKLSLGQDEDVQEVSSSSSPGSTCQNDADNRQPKASTSRAAAHKSQGLKNKGNSISSKVESTLAPRPSLIAEVSVSLPSRQIQKKLEQTPPQSRRQFPAMLPSMPDLISSSLINDHEMKVEPATQSVAYHQPTWKRQSFPSSSLQLQKLKHGPISSDRIGNRVPLPPARKGSVHTAQQFCFNTAKVEIQISTDRLRDLERKKKAEQISQILRNLLKLPKAHKWVCYEWFYSNIDQALFKGDNDFQTCIKDSFPNLKTDRLTRSEWGFIRRLMGKPRRCSQRFFEEEREELEKRRQKVRMIQQRCRLPENWSHKGLPEEIPMLITIGSKVTARVRTPQDGIFSGTVEGVDNSNHTYRINFDRKEIGTHSIVDYEVLSDVSPETISLASLTMKIVRAVTKPIVSKFMFQNPTLFEKVLDELPESLLPVDAVLGGFPVRLLEMIVRLSKLLKVKWEKTLTLKQLNVEAEKMKAYGKPYPNELRMRYAKCISELGSANKLMNKFLQVLQMCFKETKGCDNGNDPDTPNTKFLDAELIQSNADKEAKLIVSTYNCRTNTSGISTPVVHNPKTVSLVEQMTSLMMQVRMISLESGERKGYELKCLEDSIQKMKTSLRGGNLRRFEDKIEIPMKRIMAGLMISDRKPPDHDRQKMK